MRSDAKKCQNRLSPKIWCNKVIARARCEQTDRFLCPPPPPKKRTRGPKGHLSCTWVQCATFLTDQPGQQFLFTHRPENTNLVEDVNILLPVKFHWIPFSGFREEVENVSANQTPGRQSCFSDPPEKHKLGRVCWDLASCHVSFNSFRGFQMRSRKCLSQSEARVDPTGPKNTNLVEGVKILLPVKCRWIPFGGLREEVENVKS